MIVGVGMKNIRMIDYGLIRMKVNSIVDIVLDVLRLR